MRPTNFIIILNPAYERVETMFYLGVNSKLAIKIGFKFERKFLLTTVTLKERGTMVVQKNTKRMLLIYRKPLIIRPQ